MPFRVSGKNLDIGGALRTRVGDRVGEAVAKYFNGGYSGHVTVGKDGFGFRTECAVHLDSGVTFRSEGMAADAYASADQAAERIERRLRRYKGWLKDRAAARTGNGAAPTAIDAPSYVIAAPDEDIEEEVAAYNPVKLYAPLVAGSFFGMVFFLSLAVARDGRWLAEASMFGVATLLLIGMAAHAYVVSRAAAGPIQRSVTAPVDRPSARPRP